MGTALKIKWLTGTSPGGGEDYFNVNAIMGLERYNEDDFMIFLGGGERVFLTECSFSDDMPAFMEE